jgi:hypothetical protein
MHQTFPELLDGVSDGGNGTEASDNYAFRFHKKLYFFKLVD